MPRQKQDGLYYNEDMGKKKLKKGVRAGIAACILAAAGAGGYFLYREINRPEPEPAETVPEPTPSPSPEPTPEPTPEPVVKADYEFSDEELLRLKQEYAEDSEIDSTLQGILVFQSGLIEEPVFQDSNNEYYLYHNWRTGEYRSWGSLAMDCECVFAEDQNSVIYGHYVYPERSADRTIMFTPLALLMDEDNYEENRYLAMAGEDEIIYYEIISVYDCRLEDGEYIPADLDYSVRNFTESYFESYFDRVSQAEFYDTGLEAEYTDRFLTLQTCIEGKHSDREIVICRQLERKPYPETGGES